MELVDGATAALVAGFDMDDSEERKDLVLYFVNSMAHNLTLPQPTEANPDPLDTEEKVEARGRRMHELAEVLAKAYIDWEAHDRGTCCCGSDGKKEPESVN